MMHNRNRFLGILFTAFPLVVLMASLTGCRPPDSSDKPEKWLKDYATELSDRGLHLQAVAAYERRLSSPLISSAHKAEMHFAIAEIYRERMLDCDNAIAHYIAIDYLEPNGALAKRSEPLISDCLTETGNFMDNRRTATEEHKDDSGNTVVAKVAGVDVYYADLERMIEDSMMAPSKMSKEDKIELLSSKIAQELMTRTALRKGYQKDAELLKKVDEFRRAQLANKVFLEEVRGKTRVEPEAVRRHYDENKELFKDADGEVAPFEAVNAQIYMRLNLENQQRAAVSYMRSLLASEKTEIFEDNIPDAD